PGEEYDVEVKCKRTAGNETFGVGLVAGGRQVLAAIDSWPPDYLAGLEAVDGKEVKSNVTTVKGQLLKNDQECTLTYSVRKEKIDIAAKGRVVPSFRGEFPRLSLYADYRVPSEKALLLFGGPRSSFLIDRFDVTPVKGKGMIIK